MGEPFEFVARFDASFELEDTLDEVHNLDKTHLEGSRDMFMREESSSLGCNNVLPNPLDHSHVSCICSLPSSSSKYYNDVRIHNPMIFLY